MSDSLSEYRKFIAKKIHQDQHSAVGAPSHSLIPKRRATGRAVSGPELASANEYIEAMGLRDPMVEKRVRGLFLTLPKYSVLEVLTNPSSPYIQEYEKEVEGICQAVAGMDMRLEKEPLR